MSAFRDLTGQHFGRLTALRCVGRDKHGNAVWLCACSCNGTEREVLSYHLSSGHTTSCGCLRDEAVSARRRINRIGRQFGRLTVLVQVGFDKHGNALWEVECSCPAKTRKVVCGTTLVSGNAMSCGCLRDEVATTRLMAMHPNQKGENHPNFKHGHAMRTGGSRTWNTWQAMINRCTQENHIGWSYYGGAGITVCTRWLGEHGFETFLADMGERPANTTIGRFGDIGNYEPGNCAWQTPKEQSAEQKKKRQLKLAIAA